MAALAPTSCGDWMVLKVLYLICYVHGPHVWQIAQNDWTFNYTAHSFNHGVTISRVIERFLCPIRHPFCIYHNVWDDNVPLTGIYSASNIIMNINTQGASWLNSAQFDLTHQIPNDYDAYMTQPIVTVIVFFNLTSFKGLMTFVQTFLYQHNRKIQR
jgi:hypothetical protein